SIQTSRCWVVRGCIRRTNGCANPSLGCYFPGQSCLACCPTGSGKTLAAFLWSLNNLMEREGQIALPLRDGDNAAGSTGRVSDSRGSERRVSEGGVKVLYISPLKALG